ncbi:MAG TPA: cupredoxin domain-containing protein [Gemmatimonadaceae bacterium]|nr:cupredoxin domain-containing protein [Gemmatimonadaceae bacterium]
MQTITTTEWLVIAGGLAAIAWVNWYFFIAGRAQPVAIASGATAGPARVTIVVDGGYSPAQVKVKAGAPVTLLFDRQDDSSCSEEIVLPDFGVRRFLPTGQQTAIEVTPPKPGRYEFMCGMSMLRGAIIAED